MHVDVVIEVTAIVFAVIVGIWRWSALTTRVDLTLRRLEDTMTDHGSRITRVEGRVASISHLRALRNGNHNAGRSRVETEDEP